MEQPHDKRWRDAQVKDILDEAIDRYEATERQDFPPALESVGAGRLNTHEIAKEYGEVCRKAVEAVMNEFLDLLLKDVERLGFNDDEEVIEAAFGAAGELSSKARQAIQNAMMLRGWDAHFHPANEAIRTQAFATLEHRRSRLEDRINRRVRNRKTFGPAHAVVGTNVTVSDSIVGVINTGRAGDISVSVDSKKGAESGL